MKSTLTRMLTLMLAFMLVVPAAAGAAAAPTVKGAAEDLRSALGRLLGEHAVLALTAMQKGYDGKADFNAAAEALNGNTEDLTQAISSVYGAEAGVAFKKVWNSHIGYFVDYVQASAAKDSAGMQKAVQNLEKYRMEQAKFFADANPYMNEQQTAEGLKMHINHLLDAFNSYTAGKYDEAYSYQREAYMHMFMTGDGIAGAIIKQFPKQFPGDAMSPASDLRSALEQLLGEHAFAAAVTLQKGIDGAPDFNNAAAWLNMNTEDLTKAIASVYGNEAGAAFKTIWNSHIGYFVDYVKATGANDAAAKQKAVNDLEKYRMEQAKFFADANPFMNEQQTAEGLKMHINHLVDAFDSYVAKDYSEAYMMNREAYTHMFMTGEGISGAIVKQFPDKFMQGMTPEKPAAPMVSKITLGLGSKMLMVDGKAVKMDVAPMIKYNRTYIPVRYLAESLGAEIKFDNATKTTWIMAGDDKLAFWIGQDVMELNGKSQKVGAKVFIENGRTHVPVRFIAELLGWKLHGTAQDLMLTKEMAHMGHMNH
ncbi:copper amine oxidase N-terminal domain-containing protein [Paenibacillus sp. F411]|uniref:copper amine oxidase N-terminal domain-containing protein n=1 Tax=Paenibacillus sp. F411 TaxID=2820239 RepID=UPI001AAF60BD|nr:copper amine oxidase N-terminal domain-containing protein [Paenibacillus sp. F411]MBO2944045.1 copper amine oxidase N-terminal domain-containing protein [Paenibacillus sp. F411]